MFDEVAARYDITNDVLTFGQVRVWRRAVVEALGIRPGTRVLDIACGTGTSTASYVRAGADAVGIDFSEGMLEVARTHHPDIDFRHGDATNLEFADDSFDAVTCSYGLRNVERPERALSEMLRVVRPGGTLVVAEFSHPTNPVFGGLYDFYLTSLLPRIGARTGSDAAGYAYLMESIRAWPDQEHLAAMIQDAGWRGVEYRNLVNGIVAIHRATKPEGATSGGPQDRAAESGRNTTRHNPSAGVAGTDTMETL